MFLLSSLRLPRDLESAVVGFFSYCGVDSVLSLSPVQLPLFNGHSVLCVHIWTPWIFGSNRSSRFRSRYNQKCTYSANGSGVLVHNAKHIPYRPTGGNQNEFHFFVTTAEYRMAGENLNNLCGNVMQGTQRVSSLPRYKGVQKKRT